MCLQQDAKGTVLRGGGQPVKDKATLERLRKVKLPTTYTEVCYAKDPAATVQASGRDANGRLQYRYTAKHVKTAARQKFQRLVKFAKLLPSLRRSVKARLRAEADTKAEVAHQAIHLLDQCRFRVGNPMYLERNQSHGLSNLQGKHVKTLGAQQATVEFSGKAGQLNSCVVRDKDTLQFLRQRLRAGGKEGRLFEYTSTKGMRAQLHPMDLNGTLREYGDITAKDFRTWQANLFFVEARLAGDSVTDSVKHAATKLYHTPSVCRSNYLHPDVVAREQWSGKSAAETQLYRFLQQQQRA
jgi:DNA topoisomerase-1